MNNMQARINFMQVDPDMINAMFGPSKYWMKSGIEHSLINLVLLRASQINHCAYCIDMHVKDARVSGETEQRLHGLNAWRETPYYSDRERAALAWTEAVTLLAESGVPDEIYEEVRQHFTETEMLGLTMVIIDINSWNRLNVSFRNPPGNYQSQRKSTQVMDGVPVNG